jgi:hypothetical protein
MHVADALSRAYLPFEPTNRDVEIADDIGVTVHSLIYELPASNSRLEEIRRQTATCPVLTRLRTFLRDGFPDKSPSWELAAYRHVSTNIIGADGLLLKDDKIIIPVDMRPAMLALIHEGHLGVEKSKAPSPPDFEVARHVAHDRRHPEFVCGLLRQSPSAVG